MSEERENIKDAIHRLLNFGNDVLEAYKEGELPKKMDVRNDQLKEIVGKIARGEYQK